MKKESLSCYHCGESCPDDTIQLDQKYFCCEGCKTVYEILESKGMEAYYEIEVQAGISARNKKRVEDYSFLDTAEAFEKLIKFRQGKQIHIELRIPQIHCASCVWLLENLYKLHPGILGAEVRFLEKKLNLRFDLDKIQLSEIAQLIANLGYAPDINLQDLDENTYIPKDRSFYYKLGVAGFCAGNIMLMSFPEYLGLQDLNFQHFFSWINLVLAIPVLFYSANIFFKSAWQGLKLGNLNIDVPVSLGILALFSQSLYEILSQTGPGYLDSLAGLVFFLLLGKWFQQKSYDQLYFDRDYRSYFPLSAKKIELGKEKQVLLSNLKKGDILYIRNEEIIPADALLLDTEAYLDYSFVSGESVPVLLKEGERVYAGAKLIGKGVKVSLLKAVSESYLSQLWKKYKKSTGEKVGFRRLTDQLARYFTYIILGIALLAASYWFFQESLSFALQVGIAVLIVACPCGLALSSPIVLGNAMRMLGRNGFFLKDSQVLEGIAEMDSWIFDKTGTLTQTRADLSFQQLHSLSQEEQSLVVALANESSHPLSKEISKELIAAPAAVLEESQEHPGAGLKGISQNHRIAIGNDKLLASEIEEVLEEGITGIAIDGKLVAGIDREEIVREDLKAVLRELGEDYELSLLTGDTKKRALKLLSHFPENSKFYWKQLPDEKLDHVKNLQEAGRKVIMMGDGLNDAGALMQADLGIVLSEQLESFSPASDIILDSARFSQLPSLIKYAVGSKKLLKGALIISLIYNTIGLAFAVQGLLSPLVAAILMPLSSISVIFWGMASTYYLARKMGLE
ncbi:MAG: heavy metal translocating P-type ATPase [Bacteroidia bacterium]|nr:heavy metal translocating P-type ATPase [Bacteroidia bacterium]